MMFNLRGSYFPDGENVWKRRAPLNARTIRRCTPGLVGFQEFQEGNLHTYQERLPGYAYCLGPEYQNQRPHAFNAIYWDQLRLELLDAGGFWPSLGYRTRTLRPSGRWDTPCADKWELSDSLDTCRGLLDNGGGSETGLGTSDLM